MPQLPDISVVDFFHHTQETKPNHLKPDSGRSPTVTEKPPTQSDKPLNTEESSVGSGRAPPPIYEQIENDSLPENLQKAAIRDATHSSASAVPKDVEFINISKENEPANRLSSAIKKQTNTFIEDFSDYSMHNLKHLVDPLKFKQTHESVNRQPEAAAYEAAAEHIKAYKQQLDEQNKKQGQTTLFKSYGEKVEKSQSYIDISQQKPKSNGAYRVQQQSQKPYLAPSVRRNPSTTSTTSRPLYTITPTTARRTSFAVESKVTTDNYNILSTTQTPYLAPFNAKQKIESNLYTVQNVAEKPSANLQQIPAGSKRNSFRDKQPQDGSEIKHSSQKLQKGNGRNHSYMSEHIDVSPKTPKANGENVQQKKMAQRLERHQIVFENKPPFSFLSSPF